MCVSRKHKDELPKSPPELFLKGATALRQGKSVSGTLQICYSEAISLIATVLVPVLNAVVFIQRSLCCAGGAVGASRAFPLQHGLLCARLKRSGCPNDALQAA